MKRLSIAVIAVVVIGGGAWLFAHRAPKTEVKPAVLPAAPLATEVTFSGRAVARTTVAVASPVEGTLEAFFVDAGAEVIQGQLLGRVRTGKVDSGAQQAQEELDRTRARLATLSSEQIAARLEVSRAEAARTRALADLDRLQKAYERQKGLWAAGATARLTFEESAKDYNDAKDAMTKFDAASKAAEARVEAVAQEIEALTRIVEQNTAATEQAKAEATSGELHSPSDGIVVARHGQPGDTVDPSVKLVEIATELTALQAIVTPDPASLGKIQAGQPAVVRIGDQEIAGAVQEVRNGEVVVYFNTGEPIHTAEVPAQVRIKF